MTTTQMLLQMGSQLQSIASQQVSRPQSATDQSGRDPSDFQSMLEDKQNQVTQQQPDQSQPAQDEPGLAPEQPDVQAAQTLAAMLVLPLQQPVVSTEQLPIQEEGTVQGVLLTGIETAPQTPVQTAQTAVETGPQPGQTQQAVPTQAQTAQAPAQNTQTETQAPVQTAQGQQQTQQTVVQTARTDDGQQADARQSEGRSTAATVQKPQVEAEVTQTQTAPVAEQPLFREVESTPVKVGDAAPLDTTAEDFDAQAAKTIAQALEKGSQKVELKLSPANLGNVTVELTRTAEGVIHVVLTAEREQAMKLLTDHAGQLGNLLQNNTGADVRVEVPQNQQGRQAWQEGQNNNHQQQGQGQQQNHSQQEQEDFLQQLRLGLIQLEEGG